jgi:hypothetical protein
MADWQRTLRLNPEWDQCKADEITLQQCAASIAVKLRALAPFSDDPLHPLEWDSERDELTERFEGLAGDETATSDEFNSIMDDLYDWGDTRMEPRWNGKKVCWIDTMSTVEA